ncbi:MAG TPA: endonuclease/exonuclease/phosphatase family protein, partial [Longimicrobiales bacterium]
VLLHAVLATPGGDLHVLATHLDAGRAPAYRQQQLVQLLAHAARDVPSGAPLLLGGDLNSDAPSDAVAALAFTLEDAWSVCGAGRGTGAADTARAGGTFPAGAPRERIDYVFYRGMRCRDARVPASTASDHRPLVVDLDLGRGTT